MILANAGAVALFLATCCNSVCQGERIWERKDLNPVTLECVSGVDAKALVEGGAAKAVLVIPEAGDDVRIGPLHCCPQGPVPFPRSGTNAAVFASGEIAKYVEKATGVRLPVVTSSAFSEGGGRFPVFVGMSAAAKAAGFSQEGLSGEAFRVTNNGRAIAIIGAPKGPIGSWDGVGAVVFGAYDFLERFVGTRFYYHGEQGVSVERLDRVVVPPVTYSDHPVYDNRYAFSWQWTDQKDNVSHVTALRFRVGANGWGAERVFQHLPHDLAQLAGPDCYQIAEDGRPTPTIPQMLCYGNPKTADALMDAYRLWYSKDPKDAEMRKKVWGAWNGPSEYSLGFCPPDHEVNCHCAYCRKIPVHKERGYWNEQGEVMGRFCQEISRRVAKEYPGKRMYFLPYYNYVQPPDEGEFADNAYFRVCFMHGLSAAGNPEVERQDVEWAKGWMKAGHGKKISGYLYRWPGSLGQIAVPFQYYRPAKRFFTYMRDYSTGWFDGIPASMATHAFTAYCIMRCEWNPDFDVDAAVKEMYRRLFGPAAEDMAAIYERFTANFDAHPMREYKKGLYGAAYQGPHFTEEETWEKLADKASVDFAVVHLKAAKAKLAGAERIYVDRFNYFGPHIALLAKKRAFFDKGGVADPKSIRATAVERGAIRVDGVLDERTWEEARPVSLVRTQLAIGAEEPDYPTEVKVLACKEGLYIGMRMEEPLMDKRNVGAPDNLVYQNDGVEATFDALNRTATPDGNFSQYYISSDGRMLYGNNACFRTQAQSKTEIAWHDGEGFWSIELFAPYSELLRNLPPEKRADVKEIKANFHRRRRAGVYRCDSSWRTNYKGHNRDVSQFGDIILPGPESFDVVIYGATPAGITAAVQATRMGKRTVLLEPTGRIGGMTTGGLGHTDSGNQSAFGGLSRKFYEDIAKHYADDRAWTRQRRSEYEYEGQSDDDGRKDAMWSFEPSAALSVLEGWERREGLDIRRHERLDRSAGKVKVEEVEVDRGKSHP